MAVPSSTYRLQIRSGFNLADAAAVTEYLSSLGVGAVYTSPLLQSASGSEHGYDVVDPTRIDTARGGDAGWRALLGAARARRLGVVVDIVPNHLGVADAAANPAWWDVLRQGRQSRYASWFDIEWTQGPLLLPVLADNADLARDLTAAGDELRYYEHRFPIAPGTGDGNPVQVHERQHYRLVGYRHADAEQNYRRFFAVTTLAGLRLEDPDVFAGTHQVITRWAVADGVDGLRVDHPDGLVDPGRYLDRLVEAAPDTWLTVEKILEPGEALPPWPVAGTTGYDALAEVQAVLVDPSGERRFDAIYHELTGDRRSFADHVEAGKRFVASTILRAEVNRLVRLVPYVARATEALTELLVGFPVYRSYLPFGAEHLAKAIQTAGGRRPDLSDSIAALASRLGDPPDELCARFQQTSGAVMAKGVEDTAYYRYTRFIALNEVGGDPGRFGADLQAFHAAQHARQVASPLGMTTLSTHDTKRGEDVRARLAVLAELPDEWSALVHGLMAGALVPNAAFGYLLWQTFVGVGFIARDRMHAYAEKAMREASDGTSWTDPDPAFESAVHAAVDAGYDLPMLHDPLADFIARITPHGWSNSLSQKLLALTMPGVPDVYQGTELWEDALVDPDNRRPVPFAEHAALLSSLSFPPPVDHTGAAKLWLVSRALRLRRDAPVLFTGYTPLRADGPAADYVVAFDRGGAVTVATRLPVGLQRSGGWRDTTITLGAGHIDVLTGRRYTGAMPVAEVLSTYPVALLAAE